MENFTLVIIDRQKDFVNPNGSLYVDRSEESELSTIYFINKYHDNIKDAILTVDWHTLNHCSFKQNGGIWPNHCVQYSEGAGISDSIIKCLAYYNIPIKVFVKGNIDNEEEYGAFDVVGIVNIDSGEGEYKVTANNKARNSMVVFDTNNLVISGVAGDYCVKSSIENLMKFNGSIKLNIKVFKEGISSIDGGKALDEFITLNRLEVAHI